MSTTTNEIAAPNAGIANWKVQHAWAKVFYNTFEEPIMALWKKVQGGRPLRPAVWTEFVEQKELWDMAWQKISVMSPISIEILTTMHDEGMEAISQEPGENYFLVPLIHALVGINLGKQGVLEALEIEGRRRFACQQFLKAVLMYVFADVYGKEFSVQFRNEMMTVDKGTRHQLFFIKQ